MKRFLWIIAALGVMGVGLCASREKPAAKTGDAAAAASPSVPATRYYPLTVGNHWDYGFKRVTSFSLVPVSGPNQDFNTTTDGTQTVTIDRISDERSGEQGKVYVQKASEVTKPGPGETATADQQSRLVSEIYLRVNRRGVWLVADGEPDDDGQSIAKVTDRQQPLLWAAENMKPDMSWTTHCQIDPLISARIVARVGKAKELKVAGQTYPNCLPVVSVADQMEGLLDVGVAKAPIRAGRLIDLTWYAPGVGVVKSHQVANFTLDPPSDTYQSAVAHFEETQELQPGYKAQE